MFTKLAIREKAWADENMAILDLEIAMQTPDIVWSDKATANIKEVLNSAEYHGSELVSTRCAATLCRVETRFHNQSMTDQFLNHFGFLIDWSHSAFAKIINHETEGQTIVYYLSREGHDLPLAKS